MAAECNEGLLYAEILRTLLISLLAGTMRNRNGTTNLVEFATCISVKSRQSTEAK